ncbi:tetratricopeptide repeat protein 4-like [Corticium candelabrum]|uniref:tetratricopeptide repeat protein 4-like n=1 Tax=Corticium candelabrum TaxID=121492 RepID=UPI002E26FCC5|nr:tetratricopeptide repeat protein 4-like [Corticium candelabrum]
MAELPDAIDELFDKLTDGKGGHKYQHGFSEENWEEEMEQVPLFMTKSPDNVDADKCPALAAMQAIIYDDDMDTPEAKALTLKNDGNEQFKKKRYDKAVNAYTEAIKLNCGDDNLNTMLYTNRAAANFYVGNNRSSLEDAKEALKLSPSHMKAIIRAALSCYNLQQYKEALDYCSIGLKREPSNMKLIDLSTKADREKRRCERDERKAKLQQKKYAIRKQQLLDALQARDIHVYTKPSEDSTSESLQLVSHASHLQHLEPGPNDTSVYLDDDGILHWPVVFLYPEHRQSDFIQDFNEQHTFLDHLAILLADFPPWDSRQHYSVETVEVFFEQQETQHAVQVDKTKTLKEALSDKRCSVREQTPAFFLVARNSPFWKTFKEQMR